LAATLLGSRANISITRSQLGVKLGDIAARKVVSS